MKNLVIPKNLLTSMLSLVISIGIASSAYSLDTNIVPTVTDTKAEKSTNLNNFMGKNPRMNTEILKINQDFTIFPEDSKIDLILRDIDTASVLRLIAKEGGKNIVIDESVQGSISAELKNISLNEAMQIILISEEIEARIENDTIFVASRPVIAKKGLNRKFVKAFKLNNSNAVDIAKILEASIFNKGYKVNESATQGMAMQAIPVNGTDPNTVAQMSSTGQSDLIDSKVIRGKVETLTPGEKFSDAAKLASEIKLQAVTNSIEKIKVNNNDGGAIVIPDTRTNSVLVAGLKEDILIAEETIKYLDKALPQVAIEVSLIEMSKEDYNDIGFSIYGHANDSSNGFNVPMSDALNYTNYTEFSYETINSIKDSLNVRLRALLQNQKAKLLANPKIIALDGSESLIKITDRIISKMDITVTQTNITYNPTLEDVGIVLNILPKVGDDGYITMRVRPSITTPLQKEDIGNYGAFATLIQTREVILQDTRVKSGETLAIAGLMKETETEVIGKVPVLGDLPYIGSLFRNKTNKKTNTELVILITPKLVSEQISMH